MINEEVQSKIYQYFVGKYGAFNYRRGWLKCNCPECGKLKMGINIAKNRINCFSCGPKPKPLAYIQELEKLETYQELRTYLNVFDGKNYFGFNQLQAANKTYIPEKRTKAILPESFTLLTLGSGSFADKARQYMKGRGFNLKTLTYKGIGYCTVGPYANHIIIPYYLHNKLVYFTGRNLSKWGEKFKNPKEEEVGIGKSTVIYNIDALYVYTSIYLVESATNALTLGDNAIGLGGKAISKNQLSTILRSPAKRFTIILDRDATLWAIKLGLQLSGHKEVRIVILPNKEDVNDLGKSKTLQYIKEAEWLNYQQLMWLKHEYEANTEFTY